MFVLISYKKKKNNKYERESNKKCREKSATQKLKIFDKD